MNLSLAISTSIEELEYITMASFNNLHILFQGMYDAAIGESHINTLLTELDVPPISPTTLKCYERIIGSIIESITDHSCEEALVEEITLTSVDDNDEQYLHYFTILFIIKHEDRNLI